MGKILVFASVVISLATAGLGFVNKTKLGETTQNLATAEGEAATAKKQVAETTKSLKEKTDALTTTTAEKEQAIAQVTQTKADLEKANSSLVEANNKVTTAESALAEANVAKAAAEKALADASTQGTAAPAAVDNEMVVKLQEQETLIAKLQSELDSTKSTTQALITKDQDRIKQQMKKGTEGRVLAVNPAWNFVVLNLGDKQGVVNNAELLVKRGNRFLGKVRVTSVEPSTSIADIVANSMPAGTTISPGDNVIFQGNEE